MKSTKFRTGMLAAVVCLATALARADSGWFWQNPLPQGSYLFGVSAVAPNTIFAVGGAGTIIKSTDGGATWTQQFSGTAAILQSISCTDANNCTAVGSGTGEGTPSAIVRTTDGGATWIPQSGGSNQPLQSVSCVDANTCTAVGFNGTILRTTNGGTTWAAQPSGSFDILFGVSCTDVNTCTVAGFSGFILRTTDGGATWISHSVPGGYYYGTSCTDTNNCTVVGSRFRDGNHEEGTILRTTDGGATWTQQLPQSTPDLFGVSCTDANNCTAVGSSGVILRTANGGTTWTSQSSGGNELAAVSFIDANTGFAVGAYGTIVHTTNAGATWTPQSSGVIAQLFGVSCADLNNCTAVGSGLAIGSDCTILRTTNGGVSWVPQSCGITSPLNAISCTDANTCTAVGSSIAVQPGCTILRTTNGGGSWVSQSCGISSPLNDISCTDANNCTTVGFGGILRTTNGGATWTLQSTTGLNAVSCTDNNTCTAVAGSTILHTTDGGATWSEYTVPTNVLLLSVSCTDANNCTAVGSQGTILRTTNGGTTWVSQFQPTGTRPFANWVSCTDANTCTVVGALQPWGPNSWILHTTDGGATWTRQPIASDVNLNSISCVDANHCTAAGFGGAILHTNTGGRTDVAIALTSFYNPSVYGQSAIFTAIVTPNLTGAPVPTGTMTFADGATTIGSANLSGGQAQFMTAALTKGSHPITVVYSGDNSFSPRVSSPPLNQVVLGASTLITIGSSGNPAVVGQNVTFTATVAGLFGTPTGNVTFNIDRVNQPPTTLSNGVATISTTTLGQGQHTIFGVYAPVPSSNYAVSTALNYIQVVNSVSQAATTTIVSASTDRTTPGQPANTARPLQKTTLTAQVSSGSGTPTGTVTFWDNGVSLGPQVPIDPTGQVVFAVQLSLGTHSIVAIYSGDSTFGGSPSTSLTIQRTPKPR